MQEHDTLIAPSDLSPSGFRTRFTPERSPTELGLGVAFALIGVGVFGVVGYYVIKEYRRRLRVRRFLQYR